MNNTIEQIQSSFTGMFHTPAVTMQEHLHHIRAFVFDWDGVFNDGTKDASGASPFNEVDSMGLNMLRFNHYLRTGTNPVVAVITGEKNEAAFRLAKRERFHAVYSSIKNKKDALMHLCDTQGITPHEVAYFFDDVLDLSVAEHCGLRMMIGRQGSPLFTALVQERRMSDYTTACSGGNNGLREACELLIGLSGRYTDTIIQRVQYTDTYNQYITERNAQASSFYTANGSAIIEQQP